MTKIRSNIFSIQAARSESAFLLGWIRALERHLRQLRFLQTRYPSQWDTLQFAIKEVEREIQEIHEERAYWLTELDYRLGD